MERPLQIGITGGIGSGKSLVCSIFQCLGVPVYNADNKAKDMMTGDPLLVAEIQNEFGEEAYYSDGAINREYLARTVFENPEKLKKLNDLIHPRIFLDYARWAEGFKDELYVMKEAALIFEARSSHGLQAVIVVTAPEELRIKRILQRDQHRTEKDIQNIIANQMSQEEKVKLADFVIVNDECNLVLPQVLRLHQHFVDMN